MWQPIAGRNSFSDILGGEYPAQGSPDELYFGELIARALLYQERASIAPLMEGYTSTYRKPTWTPHRNVPGSAVGF
jgi:hypothetical protein